MMNDMNQPIINRKEVKENVEIRKTVKLEKKHFNKGNRKVLKNYIGKVVRQKSSQPELEKMIRINREVKEDLTSEQLIQLIRDSKLTGMSGNGFSTADKIQTFLQAAQHNILIVNAVECEPGLIHDSWLLEHGQKEIDRAVLYIQKSLGIKQVYVASKSDIQSNAEITYVRVPARYPMGEEHFMIKQVLGIELSKNDIPAKMGILVLNVQTVYQILRIVTQTYDGGRFITVANVAEGEAKIAYVHNEEEINKLVDNIYSKRTNATIINEQLYAGGGVMSVHAVSQGETIDSTISFIGFATNSKIHKENQCKKCGGCTRKCPAGVMVKDIIQAVEKKTGEDTKKYHSDLCIHCGSCTYFCPASKNVSEIVKGVNR